MVIDLGVYLRESLAQKLLLLLQHVLCIISSPLSHAPLLSDRSDSWASFLLLTRISLRGHPSVNVRQVRINIVRINIVRINNIRSPTTGTSVHTRPHSHRSFVPHPTHGYRWLPGGVPPLAPQLISVSGGAPGPGRARKCEHFPDT